MAPILHILSVLLILSIAELAGVAAAVAHDYFLIATNSENSMRQITNQIGYPELHAYHIHHNFLETITKAIHNSDTLHQIPES